MDDLIWVEDAHDNDGFVKVSAPSKDNPNYYNRAYQISKSVYEQVESSIKAYYAALELCRKISKEHDRQVKLAKMRLEMARAHDPRFDKNCKDSFEDWSRPVKDEYFIMGAKQ